MLLSKDCFVPRNDGENSSPATTKTFVAIRDAFIVIIDAFFAITDAFIAIIEVFTAMKVAFIAIINIFIAMKGALIVKKPNFALSAMSLQLSQSGWRRTRGYLLRFNHTAVSSIYFVKRITQCAIIYFSTQKSYAEETFGNLKRSNCYAPFFWFRLSLIFAIKELWPSSVIFLKALLPYRYC
jgi:hypothetical protein